MVVITFREFFLKAGLPATTIKKHNDILNSISFNVSILFFSIRKYYYLIDGAILLVPWDHIDCSTITNQMDSLRQSLQYDKKAHRVLYAFMRKCDVIQNEEDMFQMVPKRYFFNTQQISSIDDKTFISQWKTLVKSIQSIIKEFESTTIGLSIMQLDGIINAFKVYFRRIWKLVPYIRNANDLHTITQQYKAMDIKDKLQKKITNMVIFFNESLDDENAHFFRVNVLVPLFCE